MPSGHARVTNLPLFPDYSFLLDITGEEINLLEKNACQHRENKVWCFVENSAELYILKIHKILALFQVPKRSNFILITEVTWRDVLVERLWINYWLVRFVRV